MAETITKYGAAWSSISTPLEIEMACIRKNGRWTNKAGNECGAGLPHHYEQMRRILWPELDGEHNGQRWHVLTRNEILNNKVTVLMGPGSSGKTHSPAWIYLCEYFCFPEETCVLISSTDMRGLRLRIWAEITSLWERAVQRFEFLPGHLIDSRVAITTDKIEDDGGIDDRRIRDMRKGLIGIPTVQNGKQVGLGKWCFPAGTLVDTPTGAVPIESIKIGDEVVNALGHRKVRKVYESNAAALVKITTKRGTVLSTPDHPFLTHLGWVNAIDLSSEHYLISADEAMSLMRRKHHSEISTKVLLHEMPHGVVEEKMPPMWSEFHPQRATSDFLFSVLRLEVEDDATGDSDENDCRKRHAGSWYGNQRWNTSEQEGDGASGFARSQDGQAVRRLETIQYNHDDIGGKHLGQPIPRSSPQSKGNNWDEHPASKGILLQDRRGVSSNQISNRSGRRLPQTGNSTSEGRPKGRVFEGAWVDSVEIHQQSGHPKRGTSAPTYRVFNLEVDGHPSYSVNGFLVHNCGIKQKRVRLIADEAQFMGPSFLSAFANLNKNEDFKACILGNPVDMIDPLGKAAEPLDGWDAHMEPEKTSVWKTRFMNGTCVNLIGPDSPNFDFPPDEPTRFKYLISREKIQDTLSFFPKDSFEYYSQCVGAMKIGTLSRRVLTRKLCEQGKALETEVIWDGPRTRIYAIDAAYGGDRCVGGWAEFGKVLGGKTMLVLHPPAIVPISVNSEKDAEYQIAEFVKKECEGNAILPSNFFHDATGRGSLGTALAREWSSDCNPVEFGGQPSDRSVSLDHYIYDPKTRERRLKLCKEHYSKFVTELWFSVRYCIEAGQLRGLTEETMDEGCMREWDRVKDDKIELETKLDMKERVGRSPDLMDWCSIIVEGARRRGFQISKLGNTDELANDRHWFNNLKSTSKRLQRSGTLDFTYA